MPQLPSGRHYCVGLDPLLQLVAGNKGNPFINYMIEHEKEKPSLFGCCRGPIPRGAE